MGNRPMGNRWIAAGGAALVAAGLVYALLGGESGGDEEQLRALVQDVADAASRRDVSGILDHVSPGFRGGGRSMASRDDLKAMLLGVLMRSAWTQVVVLDRQLAIEGDRASGTVRFVGLRGQKAPSSLSDLAPGMDAHEVEIRLEREGGRWMVVEAVHTPLRPGIR